MNWTRFDRLDRYGRIGWCIGAIRRERKLTDIEVAEKLQMELKIYRRMEKKGQTHSLTISQAYKIAEILGCSLEEFISL
ncbi:MAG: helix-turn-helix domain-containing protein [Actinobacteria bacterium]|nr:helix-turn-helix domain-containing protein [Actinomycetota bacterium]